MEGAFVKRGIVENLKGKIQEAEENKQKLLSYIHQLKDKVVKRELSYYEYEELLEKKLQGRTLHEWLDFYEDYIKNCGKKISEHKKKKTRKKILISFYAIFTIILLFSIASFLRPTLIGYVIKAPSQEFTQQLNLEFSSSRDYEWQVENPGILQSVKLSGLISGLGEVKIYLDNLLILDSNNIKEKSTQNPTSAATSPITGLAIGEESYSEQQEAQPAPSEPPVPGNLTQTENIIQPQGNTTNITQTESITNITQPPTENITPTTPEENIITKEFTNICEETCNLGKLNLNKSSYTLKIEITNSKLFLQEITYEIIPEEKPEVPVNITLENITAVQEPAVIGQAVRWKANIKGKTLEEAEKNLPKTRAIISSREISLELYEFEYETPAPEKIEQETKKGKIITISGPEEIHYENVLAYTQLTREAPENRIKLYHLVNESKEPIQFTAYDKNENGLIDYIEWNVPSLSNQTYELIIEISKAEHLDSNKEFISDIYEQVYQLDDIWSEEIPSSHYVRVTFFKNLTSNRDITIFPRIISGNPKIEVYELGSQEKIAEFSSLNSNEYNKVYLTNLIGSQDVFDLKILGGSIEINHIIDPTLVQYYLVGRGITGNYMNGSLQTTTGSGKAIWQTSATGQYYTWIKQYTDSKTLDVQTFVIGFYCNATATAGGDKVEVDDFYVYDCGTSSNCATQDATICSVTAQSIACDFTTAATFNTISCTSSLSRTLDANDYLGVRLVADIADLKTPDLRLHFNSTAFNSHFNVTETTPDLYPNLTLFNPQNTSYSTNILDINYTAQDETGLSRCWWGNATGNSSFDATCSNFTQKNFQQGSNLIYIYANDTAGNLNQTNVTFFIDSLAPLVDLTSPLNNSEWNNATIWFSANSTEANSLRNATLYIWNGSLALIYNVSNTSITGTSNLTNFSYTFSYEGNFTWNYKACDIYNNCAFNLTNWTFNYTTPKIAIELLYPTGDITANQNSTFNVTVNVSCQNTNCGDINVTLTWGNLPLFFAIGPPATDRGGSSALNTTRIVCNNNATENGSLTLWNVYVFTAGTGWKAKIFRPGSTSGNFSFIGESETQSVSVGLNTFSTSIPRVQQGDCIAVYTAGTGAIEGDTSGVASWTKTGDITSNGTGWSSTTWIYSINGSGNVSQPFYVNASNPINISLNLGESKKVIFWVNATGSTGTWEFYSYANWTQNMSNSNSSSKFNVTIQIVTNTAPNNPIPYLRSIDEKNSSFVDLNCSSTITDSETNKLNVTIKWYRNATLNSTINYEESYASGTVFNATLHWKNLTVGTNWTCEMQLYDGALYSDWVNSTNITVYDTGANITHITNYTLKDTIVNPVENNLKSITLNFTVYDPDGYLDIDNTGVTANFSKTGQQLRQNSSCLKISGEDTANSSNFTCTISMWYFDINGTWTIEAFAKDLSANATSNKTTVFDYSLLTSFEFSPKLLSFNVTINAINRTAENDPIILNNTGNDNITSGNIKINAIDLLGMTDNTKRLNVSNFSVDWDLGGTPPDSAECSGNILQNATDTAITGANLSMGNVSKDDGTGQERLYFCIPQVPMLSSQTYATNNSGAWAIKITASIIFIFTPNLRRKKKRKLAKGDKLIKAIELVNTSLKEDYSLNKKELFDLLIDELKEKYRTTKKEIRQIIFKEPEIPATIFSKNLGCLEALTRYMKENLNLRYREISSLLNRDERTIWTACNKAIKKQKESIKPEETETFLPVSIFQNRKLTVLESTILYLKSKGFRHVEIAKLIERDQRNIYTIYSRAVKKIKRKI